VKKTKGKGLLKVPIINVHLVMLVINQKEVEEVKCKISALNNLDLGHSSFFGKHPRECHKH
jgi:hypothetical protein